MQIAVLGIDLGKNSCSVVGLDASGRVVLRRRLHREGVVKLAAEQPGCVMAMEACCDPPRFPWTGYATFAACSSAWSGVR
jgi:hypothetical protein